MTKTSVDDVGTAAEFERHRAHLTGVAYRMLGTLADAEDAVQEAWCGSWTPDVVLRSDGGGRVGGVARRPVAGSDKVARLLLAVAARHEGTARPCTVNGSPGLVFETAGEVVGVMGFVVDGGRITGTDFVVNPEKLRRVGER